MTSRRAAVKRTTSETDIELELVLDGSGTSDIDTGIGVDIETDIDIDHPHTLTKQGVVGPMQIGTAARSEVFVGRIKRRMDLRWGVGFKAAQGRMSSQTRQIARRHPAA